MSFDHVFDHTWSTGRKRTYKVDPDFVVEVQRDEGVANHSDVDRVIHGDSVISIRVDQVVSNQDVGHDGIEIGNSLKEVLMF